MPPRVHIKFTHLPVHQELIKGIFIKFCMGQLSSQLNFVRSEVLTVALLAGEVPWM
jgi:hypothetical protein